MVTAYLGAVLAGVIAFDIALLAILTIHSRLSGKIAEAYTGFSSDLGGYFAFIVFCLAVEFVVISIIAAPFTLSYTLLNGIAWKATHINALIFGSLCAVLTELILLIVFIIPTTSLLYEESDRFKHDILTAFIFGAAAIPSGAIAGSVYWRLGLRLRSSSHQYEKSRSVGPAGGV